ncbi:MAG: PKD domain-containing protein [Vicinamibacteria bacterium]
MLSGGVAPLSAQQLTFSIHVQDTDGKSTPKVRIGTTGGSGTEITDLSGNVQMALIASIGPGGRTVLQLASDELVKWSILEPDGGEISVPKPGVVITVVLGDRQNQLKSCAFLVRRLRGVSAEQLCKAYDSRNSQGVVVSHEIRGLVRQLERSLSTNIANIKEDTTAMRGDMTKILAILEKKPQTENTQSNERAATLTADIRQLQSDLKAAQNQSAGEVEHNAELERRYDALMRRYQALVERVPPEPPMEPSGHGKQLGIAALALGGIGAGVVLAKKEPQAGAASASNAVANVFYSSGPCTSDPCNFLVSVTAVLFAARDPDTANFDYEWDFGDGQTVSGTNVSHVFSREGTFTVTLTALRRGSASRSVAGSFTRPILVGSLTGIWQFESSSSQGSYQLIQAGTSISGVFNVGSSQGNVSGTLANPRIVKMNVGFGGDTLDGTEVGTLKRITGNFRVGSTGAIQPFTMTRAQ